MSVSDFPAHARTAFVFAGGGSFGAIQVGMMHSLAAHGVSADMVVGSSVGALNGAFYAGDPTLNGVLRLETIWRGLLRQDVFPVTWRTLLGFLWRRDFLMRICRMLVRIRRMDFQFADDLHTSQPPER